METTILSPERHAIYVRRLLLSHMLAHLENGYRDPELLYLGGRFALSMGMYNTAEAFLKELDTMMCPDGNPCQAYAPVGLLMAETLCNIKQQGMRISTHDLKSVRSRLEQLSLEVQGLPDMLAAWNTIVAYRENPKGPIPEAVISQGLQQLLHDTSKTESHFMIESQWQTISPSTPVGSHNSIIPVVSPDFKKAFQVFSKAVSHATKKISIFSQAAAQAYEMKALMISRLLLEKILLMNGDHPEVLRNLITLTSEQRDEEAYQRYWKRYVKCLFWRIICRDGTSSAWDELEIFYRRVSNVAERECNKPANEIKTIIERPGFLQAWLEANGALIWLRSVKSLQYVHQNSPSPRQIEQGQQGTLSLMRFWFQIFYPEFLSYLSLGQPEQPADEDQNRNLPLPASHIHYLAGDDPACLMVKRFLQWSEFSFGLSHPPEPAHAAAVTAAAGLVVRIPEYRYMRDIGAFCKKELREGNHLIGQQIKDACSLAMGLKLKELMDEKNWQGMITLYGEPDIEGRLSHNLRMFAAFAYCQCEMAQKGFDIACRALPEFTEKDIEEKSDARQIWMQVIQSNVESQTKGVDSNTAGVGIQDLQDRIRFLSLPEHLIPFQSTLCELLENAYTQTAMKSRLDKAIEKSKEYVNAERFDQAREIIGELPNAPPAVKEIKEKLLDQINDAERHILFRRRIETAIQKSKDLVESGDFAAARRVIRDLPDSSEDITQLKSNLLGQIDQAAEQANLRVHIDTAIEESKRMVGNGNFDAARRAIRSLPDRPEDLKQLKSNLLGQIDEAAENATMKARIDAIIEDSKRLIGKSDYNGARRAVRNLPDRPAEVAQLKQSLLGQIDQVERDMKTAIDKATALLTKFQRKGVDMEAVSRIARDNDIDISNPMQLYSLLKAIDERF